jgi:hypothetical protein
MQLRAEPHVQASIEKMLQEEAPPITAPPAQPSAAAPSLDKLPEPEPLKSTMRLNVDVDFDVYTEAHIKARRQGKKLSEVVRAMLVEYLSK